MSLNVSKFNPTKFKVVAKAPVKENLRIVSAMAVKVELIQQTSQQGDTVTW